MERERSWLQPQSIVSRLPTETLCDIFAQVAVRPPVQIRDPSDLKDIISVTHVCKLWRNIAVNTPSLWTQIDNLNPRVTEVFVERSKDALLELDISLTGPFQPTINRFIPLISRAVVLDIRVRCGDTVGLRTVEMILRNAPAAPHMKSICLVGADWDHIPLPAMAFRGHSPALRNVQIRGFTVPFNSQIYRGLRRLEVALTTGAPQMSMSELLEILSQCPDLESVDLSNAGPTKEEHENSLLADTISLPNLTSVSITNATSLACFQLFDHIDVPNLSDLCLVCSDSVSDLVSLVPKRIRQSIRQRLSVPDIVRVTSAGPCIQFQAFNVRSHRRAQGKQCAHSAFSYTVPTPPIPFGVSSPSVTTSVHEAIADVLRFSQVRMLVVDDEFSGISQGNVCALADILRLFPSAEMLKYTGTAFYSTISPVGLHALLGGENGKQECVLPKLQHLHLREVALSRHSPISQPCDSPSPSSGVDLLEFVLQFYSNTRTYPLDVLTLETCSVSRNGCFVTDKNGWDDLSKLRMYVKDVKVEKRYNHLKLPYVICGRTD